jgi:hypothetical protein
MAVRCNPGAIEHVAPLGPGSAAQRWHAAPRPGHDRLRVLIATTDIDARLYISAAPSAGSQS